jgi:hypothetical protein
VVVELPVDLPQRRYTETTLDAVGRVVAMAVRLNARLVSRAAARESAGMRTAAL